MDQNIMRVLQLVQDGKITAQEGERLISAMSGRAKAASPYPDSASRQTTAVMDPPVTSVNPETTSHPDASHYARSFGLPTGELLQQIADDPSIPEHDKLAIIINATSLLCAVLIIQPIPLADFFILTPIQVAGVLSMSQVMGQPLGKNGAGEMVTSIAAVMGGGFLAQQLMVAGVKTLVPIFGVIAIIPVVYAGTYGLMTAARAVLEARRNNQQLPESEIRRIKLEAEQRAKNEKRDWSPGALRSELEGWRAKGEAFKEYEIRFTEEQARARPLQEQIDRQMEQVVRLSSERMDLERRVRETATRLADAKKTETETDKETKKDEERQALRADHDHLVASLERVHALWASQGSELEALRTELEAIAEGLEGFLRERFERCYPNVRLASGIFTELMHLAFPTLLQVERQVSLLQYDPVKANYRNEPFHDTSGQEIRQVAVEGDIILYVASQGSDVFVRAIGTPISESDDIARLRS